MAYTPKHGASLSLGNLHQGVVVPGKIDMVYCSFSGIKIEARIFGGGLDPKSRCKPPTTMV